MDRYEKLANAIILRAVDDYRIALRQLRQKADYQPAVSMKHEVERFFHSEWLSMLTRVDGVMLLDRLNAEVAV